MKYYGIYDLKDYEQCVFIGNLKEVANFLGFDKHRIHEYVCRKVKAKHRYQIISMNLERNE